MEIRCDLYSLVLVLPSPSKARILPPNKEFSRHRDNLSFSSCGLAKHTHPATIQVAHNIPFDRTELPYARRQRRAEISSLHEVELGKQQHRRW